MSASVRDRVKLSRAAKPFAILHRRRAERFAELLDQKALAAAPGSEPRHRLRSRYDADLAGMVALTDRAAAVRLTASADPDPAFRADLRAMLVAAAQRGEAGQEPAPPARRRVFIGAGGRARVAIVAGVVAGVLAVSGIAAASGDAKPGDPLYGVKRSTERAELAFAGSDAGRGHLYLDFARTRLAEAKSVTGDADNFRQALDDMDSNTRDGVKLLTAAAVNRRDPETLDAVDAFVRRQQRTIGDVLDTVDGALRARLLGSLDLLERVATRARRLRQTLTCDMTPDGGSDALGPRPGACPPASSPAPVAPDGRSTPRPTPSRTARGQAASTPGPASHKPAAATPTRPAGADGNGQAMPSAIPGKGAELIAGLRGIIEDLLGAWNRPALPR